MPALSRSFHNVWLKTVLSGLVCASPVDALKSAAATLMVAPRFVPVRKRSCADAWVNARPTSKNTKNSFIFFNMVRLIFDNQTRTRRGICCPSIRLVTGQTYQCAQPPGALIGPAMERRWIAQYVHSWACHLLRLQT